MRAELGLPSVKGDDEHGGGMTGGFGGSMGGAGQTGKGKRPINVKFEIPYFTTSGIQVRYLKIIEPKVVSSSIVRHLFSMLTISFFFSYNTLLCRGCDTSHNQATLQCVYQMYNDGVRYFSTGVKSIQAVRVEFIANITPKCMV